MKYAALPRAILCFSTIYLSSIPSSLAADPPPVEIREETIVLPTYLAGDPDPNPMFYFGRVSQGAEGRIYPYPLYDTLTGQKVEKSYTMVWLENEYLRIGVLPEIGGRIFEGVDKTNGYHFLYRQHVIKPALIGLIGAWISGGVEWNIPHHHRATTFIPVQHRIEEKGDGSRTVWVGELEIRHRMRWAVGYTLRPGSSVLTASVRILNRTPVENTMLCFANVAVHVNENYQILFPPGTRYVTHHHKREFTTWPVATTRYGGWDFSGGVDVSWFRNHISANSMFAWNYEDDFFAGYDHGKEAGLMSVANHHIVPGKKLWTWGNGPRGRMWDRILTDEDGPYIELMVGAYSDNQPDYSWLAPYEVKSFDMHWYPFRGIGGVKNANLDAAVNLELTESGTAHVGFHTTAFHPGATARLVAGDRVLLEETISIEPGRPYKKEVALPAGIGEPDLRASLSAGGRELVAHAPARREPEPMPEPVRAPPAPGEIETNEKLYLTGLRIEQFHNAALDPDPYWEEALRRDAGDARVNTALGIRRMKELRFAEAEGFFQRAVERLTRDHTTPKNAEPFYYLGLALRARGKCDEAFDRLYKATWSAAWRAAAYYQLAEIACGRDELSTALDLVDRSLEANALNIRALNLKAALLRHLGRPGEAMIILTGATRRVDPLDVRSMAERWLASEGSTGGETLASTLLGHPATAQETAAEYLNAGLWEDGQKVLSHLVSSAPEAASLSPMVFYYLAEFATRLGQTERASDCDKRAVRASPGYVFPFQAEAVEVLRRAMERNPRDARAPYYLGNLLFDRQPARATELWERSVDLDPSFAIVHRNLAIAYSHRGGEGDLDRAIASLRRAVSQSEKYPRHFYELDELCEARGVPPAERLAVLEANQDVVEKRDDALSRMIALKVFAGKLDEAIELMSGREFEVWEGGRLTVADTWTDAHLLRGHRHLAAGDPGKALVDYRKAGEIPANLPSERGARDSRGAEVDYWIGVAHEALGETEEAREAWKRSAARAPGSGGYDVSDRNLQRHWAARALEKLGSTERAREIDRELLESAERALERRPPEVDVLASFGEQSSQRGRLARIHFLRGLARLALGNTSEAQRSFRQALEIRPDHVGAREALKALE